MDNTRHVSPTNARENSMCGIAGIVNYQEHGSSLKHRAIIMRDNLHHRGPDDQDVICYPNVAIAHTRLALIDLLGGAQPLRSSDHRYSISYNGEVYNYQSLRKDLEQDWVFRTNSDTEVILAAYAQWGEDCLTRFNGMFSFFIWDSVKNEGFAARDLLGVKPFAYQYLSGEFVFASEAKAIIAIQQSAPKANTNAIIEYLTCPYFSGVEEPMFEGLEYLQPGHYLKITHQGVYCQQWGDYELTGQLSANKTTTEELSELLINSVQQTMISDVPIAAYLSGGFDSTLITSLAKKHATRDFSTFTVQFTDQNKYHYDNSLVVTSDDMPFAIDAAQEIGVRQHIVNVNRVSLAESIKQLACSNDALPAWEQEIAQHHLAYAASQKYKAVLVGDAADETHYGYQFLLDSHATQSPSGIIQRFSLPPLKPGLISNPLNFFDEKYKALTTQAGHSWKTAADRSLATTYLIVKRWLPRLLHNGDIHAMHHSLEARVPFADINLINMAQKIHPDSGYHNGTEKWLLRQSAKGLLPETARVRKKSALPKDQGTELLYKKIANDIFKTSREFLEHFLEMEKMHHLCKPEVKLNEQERALLFRTISLCYWREAYGVNIR